MTLNEKILSLALLLASISHFRQVRVIATTGGHSTYSSRLQTFAFCKKRCLGLDEWIWAGVRQETGSLACTSNQRDIVRFVDSYTGHKVVKKWMGLEGILRGVHKFVPIEVYFWLIKTEWQVSSHHPELKSRVVTHAPTSSQAKSPSGLELRTQLATTFTEKKFLSRRGTITPSC